MSVIQAIQNLVRSARAGQSGFGSGPIQLSSIRAETQGDFLRARTELLNLFRAIERLAELSNINTRFKLDLPDARSQSPLGLDMANTAATLNFNGEINASTTTFTPFGPDWQGASTADITIGGEYLYDPATNSPLPPNAAYTFESRRNGTRGSSQILIRVEDPFGNRNNVAIARNDPLNQQYDLGSGLYFTIGPGSTINRDTTNLLTVSDSIGSAVNPNLPLGGIRNQNPDFQFGALAIEDGSFDLNGENISVSTTDTLNDIVDRINQSNADVTAVFDASSNARLRGDFATVDHRELTSNLQRRDTLVRDFLAGKGGKGGLVKGLLAATQQALGTVNLALGLSGTFVDTYA